MGDSIQTISGDAGIVTGLELEKLDRPIFVYNLDIEDLHSYFVADGVLVHNVCTQGRGSTGRTEPKNLMEEMAYEATKKYPRAEHNGRSTGIIIRKLKDKRWKNWQKYQTVFTSNNGKKVVIHFNYDPRSGAFDDFKFD